MERSVVSSVYSIPDDVSMASGSSRTQVGAGVSTVLATRLPGDDEGEASTVLASRPVHDDDDGATELGRDFDTEVGSFAPEPWRPKAGIYQIRAHSAPGWCVDMYGLHGVHSREVNKVAMFPANRRAGENINQRFFIEPVPGTFDEYTVTPFCCKSRGMQLALGADGKCVVKRVPPGAPSYKWRFLLAVGRDVPPPPPPQAGEDGPTSESPALHIRSTDPSPGGFEKANLEHELGASGSVVANMVLQRTKLAEAGASMRNPSQLFVLQPQALPTHEDCCARRVGSMSFSDA